MTDNIQAEEDERYHTEMVCIYCGKPMLTYLGLGYSGDIPIPCCGEVRFDTQANIDGEKNV